MTRKAVIAGGGIGGLTAAVALTKAGWDVTVCEQAPALTPAGFAISLAPNALRALDTLGIGDDIRALGAPDLNSGIRLPDGEWLTRAGMGDLIERHGEGLLLLRRSDLIDVLAKGVPDLRLDTTVEGIALATAGPRLVTSDGDLTADLVVAADGANSVLRRLLFPQHPGLTYAGYGAFRWLARMPGVDLVAAETWGNGERFGIMPMAGDDVYAFAVFNARPGRTYADPRAELRRRFAGWHEPVGALIAAAEDVQHHDVYELAAPLPAFCIGQVALLGDAAHAMTPNLGQGGCQSIEDAVVLAHHLRAYDVRRGLAAYSRARRPRTLAVARTARQLGLVAGLSSPLGVRVRDSVFRLSGKLPPRLNGRPMDGLLDWRPPRI
ncbi:FAD-dependent monooxygenase [Fodinicola acaciae]|uniref:FAD-dependent monooxygenase n=1 Tax=Fodinicola acaciae TaxID=2681555 RepID=UPI0013D33D8B|nr:FAD-dependent monooxygenase [Fodinicola acaciae]